MSAPDDVREQLAALEHEQWSHWHRYLTQFVVVDDEGRWILDSDKGARWQRLMQTPYADLTAQEQESDRAAADRVLEILVAVLASAYLDVLDGRAGPARTECRALLRRLAERLGVNDLHERARRLQDAEAQP